MVLPSFILTKMKKILKISIIVSLLLSVFSINSAYAQIGGGVTSPNFFKRVGTAINLIQSTWTWGSSSVRNDAYFDDVDATTLTTGTLTISGTSSGNITIKKADPTLIYDVTTATDTDFWAGVQDDAGGDDDDVYQIGKGTTPGTTPYFSIYGDGLITHTATLDNSSGNEVALTLNYTTNKAAGNDTGLLIAMTDTASPGSSLPLDIQVGGVNKFSVDQNGGLVVRGTASLLGGAIYGTSTLDTNVWYSQYSASATGTGAMLTFANATRTNTSGTQALVKISAVYNQASGTAANTDLLISRTQTAVGSGIQRLADFQVGGTSMFGIDNLGSTTHNRTITAGGTTGNQTINKPSGTVNIAAAGTTVTVTNSLVDTNSIVHVVLRTADATATIKNVVPGAGSFAINLGAAATAEVSIGFLVTN